MCISGEPTNSFREKAWLDYLCIQEKAAYEEGRKEGKKALKTTTRTTNGALFRMRRRVVVVVVYFLILLYLSEPSVQNCGSAKIYRAE